MNKLILLFFAFWYNACFFGQTDVQDGDLVFIVNPSGQGRAIQLATGSRFTHVGIVFLENGKPVVYHAVEPVSRNTLEEFVAMSADDQYVIRRLKDRSVLTKTKVASLHRDAIAALGRHYDLAFNWSDDELYCSEFVWKLYFKTLGLEIGQLKPLKSFRLDHPLVRAQLEARYGKAVPLDEKMISPGDMYDSALLR